MLKFSEAVCHRVKSAVAIGIPKHTGTCSKIATIVIVLVCVPESEHKQQGRTLGHFGRAHLSRKWLSAEQQSNKNMRCWNLLPTEVVCAESPEMFQNKLWEKIRLNSIRLTTPRGHSDRPGLGSCGRATEPTLVY